MTSDSTNAFAREVRMMLQAAMVLFIFTVAVGILNGIDLVEFERKALLTHVHVGTLGWITLSVLAASLWLFGGAGTSPGQARAARFVAYLAPVSIAAYSVAFLTTIGGVRPILGTLVTVVIVVSFAWILVRMPRVTMSTPHVGVLAAVATSVIGAVLGVILGLQLATGNNILSENVSGAHPATMVVGFLVPVGMAMAEWALRPESIHERAGRLGWLQIGLPFLGGLSLMIGVLADVLPLIMLNLPFEIAGIAIFLWRMFPALRTVRLFDRTPARHALLASLFLVFDIGFLAYLISNYADDFDAAPLHLILALDHTMFVGVLTNVLLAFIVLVAGAGRRAAALVDDLVFWGLNAGVILFIAGLVAESAVLKRIGTPVLGLAILLAIAAYTMALQSRAVRPAAAAGD